MGLWYPKDSGFELKAFADADYAGCHDTRRSTSGSAQFLGHRLVSWSSKKAENYWPSSTTKLNTSALSDAVLKSSGCGSQQQTKDLRSTKFRWILSVPESNQVVDIHDPNEMVDIPDDVHLVYYDGDDEENPEEDPEEDPEEEPEPNNGLVNQFTPHVDPHQPSVMIGWLEENDGVNECVNNEDIEDEDVEIELDDDAELIFPYEVEGDKNLPHGGVSSNSKPPNASHLLLSHLIQCNIPIQSRGKGCAVSRARSRVTEAELGTCQTEIALLKSKNKIGEKEREIPNHDLGNVEHVLGDVLERLKVLESRENATSKKKLVEAEMKLELARMEHDMVERRLHASYGWNKRFYMEMVRIGAVPKPPSDDEGTERPRKKSKNSTFDGTEGPSKPRGPPSDS
ncbi:hypothetical protein Tco_0651719 [Tanacetum coccineum]|uniref:Uncharacterized protein n=1 Tax=Tanacetum coccineum TaxID=301880 RepID=A0ABQ4WVL6_9ASTR